jgi:hypothetical protein
MFRARSSELGTRSERQPRRAVVFVPHSAFPSPGGWSRTSSSAFSARRFNRVSFAGNRPVPRQGIEPCVCRLKAGGFAIEACEARVLRARNLERGVRNESPWPLLVFGSALRVPSSSFAVRPGSGGRNRTCGVRLQRAASVPALNPPEHKPSCRGWNRTSAIRLQRAATVPTLNPRQWRDAAVALSSGGRNRTYKMRFNRAPPYHSAPHRFVKYASVKTPSAGHLSGDARPTGAVPCRYGVMRSGWGAGIGTDSVD